MTEDDDEDDLCYYCQDYAPEGEYWTCPKCDAQWYPEEDEDEDEDEDD